MQRENQAGTRTTQVSKSAVAAPALSRAEWLCLISVAIVTALSVAKAPVIPVNDPALYEYFGRRLTEGAHLYTDLPDVKLPSLYYVNALYQLAFGSNYTLHACAEAGLNLLAVVLFALVLRGHRLSGWAPATLLFAIVYSLAIDQFNYPEFYAVPLILLAYYLALRGLDFWSGMALALATTFWVQSPIMILPLLAQNAPAARKRMTLLGLALTGVAFILAIVPVMGLTWIEKPIATWPGFLQTSLSRLTNAADVRVRLSEVFLHGGIAALLALVLLAIRRPSTDAQRFSLWWLACAFPAALFPPSLLAWYFVPVMPPATMVVAAYGVSRDIVRRRALVAVLASGLCGYAVWLDYRDTVYINSYATYVRSVGQWIRDTMGKGTVMWAVDYLPELYLSSGAAEPYAGAINAAHVVYTKSYVAAGASALQVGTWTRAPQIVAEGGPQQPPPPRTNFYLLNTATRVSYDYIAVCRGAYGVHIRLYAVAQECAALAAPYPGCRC